VIIRSPLLSSFTNAFEGQIVAIRTAHALQQVSAEKICCHGPAILLSYELRALLGEMEGFRLWPRTKLLHRINALNISRRLAPPNG
jgi:hypothetical protein